MNLNIYKSHGKPLCKVIGGEAYQKASTFSMMSKEFSDLSGFSALLTKLEGYPKMAVTRHALKDGVEMPFERKGNMEKVECPWLCLDYDDPQPEGCPEYSTHPEDAIAWMIEHKWPFLSGVGIHWQLGNSAGIVESSTKMSLHLWVLLDRPVLDCKEWLIEKGFDCTLMNTGQLHYTASPEVRDGAEAPKIARRSGLIEGGVLSGVPETVKAVGVAFKGTIEQTCPDYVRDELVAEANAMEIDGPRHDWAMGWTLRAVTSGLSLDDVFNAASDTVMRAGYSQERADTEIWSMINSAKAKLESGELAVDTTLNPLLAFDTEVEDTKVADVAAQELELCGPTFIEELRESLEPLELIKSEQSKFLALDEFQMLELGDILKDAGVLVDSKPKKGQLTAAKLDKLRKSSPSGVGSVTLDPAMVDEFKSKWENTYCTLDQKTYGYFFFSKADNTLRSAAKRDELDSMCQYLSADLPKNEQILFRERFYREIHEKRQISEWITKTKPFGESRTHFEQLGDGKLNAVVEASVIKGLEVLKNRSESVEVPVEFERFLDTNYAVVWDVLKGLLARRFLGNKRSTIWLHCSSNWGKSFFFGLGDFAMTMNNQYTSEDFKGNDPAELARYIYMFVDEADRFTKEMKLDAIPYRRLWGGMTRVTLPARVLASANPIKDLSDGVDKQLMNRLIKIRVEGVDLETAITVAGWSVDKAREWYEALVARRMHSWLMEWGETSDFTETASQVYRDFIAGHLDHNAEDIETMIRDDFWAHFIWEHVYKVGAEYRLKTHSGGYMTAWAIDYLYVDNGSSTEPERRRLYIKRPGAWMKAYSSRSFGDKMHAVSKTMGTIDEVAKMLGGEKCDRLPNQMKFKGLYFDISAIEGLEEVFAEGVKA